MLIRSSVNSQHDCPLFSKLAGELRLRIYELVLKACEDSGDTGEEHEDKQVVSKTAASSRALVNGRIDMALLLACRLIYHEAWSVPITVNKIIFHVSTEYKYNLGPDWENLRFETPFHKSMTGLTDRQLTAIDTLYIPDLISWPNVLGHHCSSWGRPIRARKMVLEIGERAWSDILEGRLRHRTQLESESTKLKPPQWTALLRSVVDLSILEIHLKGREHHYQVMDDAIDNARTWCIPLLEGQQLEWNLNLQISYSEIKQRVPNPDYGAGAFNIDFGNIDENFDFDSFLATTEVDDNFEPGELLEAESGAREESIDLPPQVTPLKTIDEIFKNPRVDRIQRNEWTEVDVSTRIGSGGEHEGHQEELFSNANVVNSSAASQSTFHNHIAGPPPGVTCTILASGPSAASPAASELTTPPTPAVDLDASTRSQLGDNREGTTAQTIWMVPEPPSVDCATYLTTVELKKVVMTWTLTSRNDTLFVE